MDATPGRHDAVLDRVRRRARRREAMHDLLAALALLACVCGVLRG
jgi:hypothetical protein